MAARFTANTQPLLTTQVFESRLRGLWPADADLVLQDGALGCSTSMNCGWWMPSAPGMPSAGDAGDDDGVAPAAHPARSIAYVA